jgi:hypothetical protein
VLFGNRYYDPNLGRFTQIESSSIVPEYAYAADNPINLSDPSGHVLACTCGGDYVGGGGAGIVAPSFFKPYTSFTPAPSSNRNQGRPQTSLQTVPASDITFTKGKPDPQTPPKPGYAVAVGLLLVSAALAGGLYPYGAEYSNNPNSTGTALYPESGVASGGRRYDRLVQNGCLSPPPSAP